MTPIYAPTPEDIARFDQKLEAAYADGYIPVLAWKFVPRAVFRAGTWLHERLEADGRYPADEIRQICEAFCRQNRTSSAIAQAANAWAERYLA